MPQTCSAAGCKSRKEKDCKKSFFRIPVDRQQREKWLAAINRRDWTPTQYSRICSDHFVLGHPTKDPNHQDYAPSLCLDPKHSSVCGRHSSPCPVLAPINPASEQNKRYLSDVDAAEALLHMSKRPRVVKEDYEQDKEESESVNFEHSSCHIALLQAENHLLREQVKKLQVQMSEFEMQRRDLEVEKVCLADLNEQLETKNRLVLKSLEDSEGMVKMLKNELFLFRFGAEVVNSQLKQSLL